MLALDVEERRFYAVRAGDVEAGARTPSTP